MMCEVPMGYKLTKQQNSKGGKISAENLKKRKLFVYESEGWDSLIEKFKYTAIKDFLKGLLLKECKITCQVCLNDTWLDKPIVLEIHHIDGNNKNIKRENLKMVCPNCHYYTANYKFRGKNHNDETKSYIGSVTKKRYC